MVVSGGARSNTVHRKSSSRTREKARRRAGLRRSSAHRRLRRRCRRAHSRTGSGTSHRLPGSPGAWPASLPGGRRAPKAWSAFDPDCFPTAAQNTPARRADAPWPRGAPRGPSGHSRAPRPRGRWRGRPRSRCRPPRPAECAPPGLPGSPSRARGTRRVGIPIITTRSRASCHVKPCGPKPGIRTPARPPRPIRTTSETKPLRIVNWRGVAASAASSRRQGPRRHLRHGCTSSNVPTA